MKIFKITASYAGKGLLALCATAALSLCSVSCSRYEFARYYRGLPFEMGRVVRPQIPDRSVSVADFGAIADGVTLCSAAFEGAMEELERQGGGHLVVPAGTWYTGPIGLRSHIDLHLEEGAVIVFCPDLDLYPVIPTVFEGLDTYRCESPIHAQGCTDISITGKGVIDGSGDAWRPLKRKKVSEDEWLAKVASGGVVNAKGDQWFPTQVYMDLLATSEMNVPRGDFSPEFWEESKSFLRPVMVSLRECTNVLLEGCTFRNSPCWNLHPLMCKGLIVKDVTVENPSYAQNGDGIDIDSCEDVLLVGSTFAVGDDGICIKSGKNEDGRRRGRPCKGLIVADCYVGHGHGGFVVGSEMSGGVSNIKVSGCTFEGTDVGLRFKSTRGRGGVVENIWIEDIKMSDIVTEALLFDLYYGGKSAVEAAEEGTTVDEDIRPVDETTPAFRDIHIKKISCDGADRAMYFNGLPEMPVKGVDIRGCRISSRRGVEICRAEDVTIRNLDLTVQEGGLITSRQVKNLTVK